MNGDIERLAVLLTQIRDAVARAPPDPTVALGLLSGDFQVVATSLSVPATVTQLFGPDPTRWALMFGASIAGTTNIFPSSTLTSGTGFSLTLGQSWQSMNFRDHGSLVQVSWFAVSSPGPATIGIIQVLYRPARGG